MDKKKRFIRTKRSVRRPNYAQDLTPHDRMKGPHSQRAIEQQRGGKGVILLMKFLKRSGVGSSTGR